MKSAARGAKKSGSGGSAGSTSKSSKTAKTAKSGESAESQKTVKSAKSAKSATAGKRAQSARATTRAAKREPAASGTTKVRVAPGGSIDAAGGGHDGVATAARAKPGTLSAFAPDSRIVLVLQGGGALGAFQVGAYRALHEAGMEPDWIIGTSIGAINAALIAGNAPDQRLPALEAFWKRVAMNGLGPWLPPGMGSALNDMAIMAGGVPGFFRPSRNAWRGQKAKVGVDRAAYYDVAPLRETLGGLIDGGRLNAGAPRLTVGAVNVKTSEMRYFDSKRDTLGLDHIMASGALPPAFPAVRIDGESYWDGGIYSNTPIEAVLDETPRHDSLIIVVNVWHAHGDEPQSLAEVMERQKDIQYASRAQSHIGRQQELHHLRHIIRTLADTLPDTARETTANRKLAGFGCRSVMHVAMCSPPHFDGEGATKDIDFSTEGIGNREASGYEQARSMLARAPWLAPADPMCGIIVHAAET
ncbi:MAG: patatin-like phospholipase family protein [Xanthomonadaceae bacterium]|nr:patatin-like phospholipase family protein [Xanthomonadaceae bacterium]